MRATETNRGTQSPSTASDMLTTAGQGNRAAESYAEGKRRVPILSTASDMQTAANLNSRAEDNRGTRVPSPASTRQTTTRMHTTAGEENRSAES